MKLKKKYRNMPKKFLMETKMPEILKYTKLTN